MKFSKNKGLILNFESGTRFQDFRKIVNYHFGLFSTPFSLEINFYLQTFWLNVLEQQLDTDLKEKLNSVSLLEFYNNYLPKKKYKQIHTWWYHFL